MASSGLADLKKRAEELEVAQQRMMTGVSLNTRNLMMLTPAIAGVVAVGALELKFLHDSARAYLEHSGKLEEHEAAVGRVKKAWNDLHIVFGAALFSGIEDVTFWESAVTGALYRVMGVAALVGTKLAAEFKFGLGIAPTILAGIPGGTGAMNLAGWVFQPSSRPGPPPADPNATFIGTSVDPFAPGGGFNPFFTPGQGERVRQPRTWVDIELERAERERARAATKAQQEWERAEAERVKLFGYSAPWQLGLSRMPGLIYDINPPALAGPLPSIGLGPLPRGFIGQNVGIPEIPGVPPTFWQQGFGSSAQFGQAMSMVMLQAMTGGGSMVQGAGGLVGAGLGTGLAKHLNLSGFMGGAAGAVLPGIGALLGPALQGIAGLFGPTAYEKRERQAGQDIAGIKGDLYGQFGGYEGTEFLARQMGIQWSTAAGWQGGGSVDPLKGIAGQIQQGAPKALNDILGAFLTTGQEFPRALQPALESLIQMGGLTQENINLLNGLPAAGVPAFAEIQRAAAYFGVEVDALGNQVRNIGLSETAEEAAHYWRILERAGADMAVVGPAAAEKMQGFVDEALKYGLTLPDSIRKTVEEMHALGLISGDLEQIEWAKPLAESVDELVLALRELVATMRGDVAGAIDDLNGREFTIRGRYEGFQDPDAGRPDTQAAAAGAADFRSRVSPRFVILEGR
jgi:hypothetical protein